MPVINPVPAAPEPPQGVVPGPCDWPLNTSCCPDWATFPPQVQANATTWATFILDALTGRQFAQCAVNYRPCAPRCGMGGGYVTYPVNSPSASGAGGPWMIPWIDNGIWRNCGCNGGCSCRASCEVPFPDSVAAVMEVRVDGLVIDPGAYRMDSYRGVPTLVRVDGLCWPQCQDMDAMDDEAGSFVITYQPGRPLPLAGQIAAGELACEFAKACAGGDCRLPSQLASLSRNGIEVQVADPLTFFENGLTGISNVDLFIRAVNPTRKAQRSRVLSSDKPGPRYQV